MAQYMNQGTTGKVREKGDRLSAGQRTAIAIVSVVISVVALIPLGIVLGQQGLGGLIALGIVCFTIFMVNAVVHGVLSTWK
jgi:hypothetical protein